MTDGDKIEDLREALTRLKIRGECWCGMANDDPAMQSHSVACVNARIAMEATGG